MTAEDFLNDELNGCYQTHTEDGIILITGIEHSEICEIMEKYAKRQLLSRVIREVQPLNAEKTEPPFSMEGFYLEANSDCIFLAYRYPSRVTVNIMKLDPRKYNIPVNNWELKKQTS